MSNIVKADIQICYNVYVNNLHSCLCGSKENFSSNLLDNVTCDKCLKLLGDQHRCVTCVHGWRGIGAEPCKNCDPVSVTEYSKWEGV